MKLTKIPDKVKVDGKIVSLKTELPRAATFISRTCPNICLFLQPVEEKDDLATKQVMAVEGTGIRVAFEGYKLRVTNKHILAMVIESKPFQKGEIGIDQEDPTGFWRECGALEVVEKPVVIQTNVKIPEIKDLDFSKITAPADDEHIEPVRAVGF